jgi:phosphatidylcholine synthase
MSIRFSIGQKLAAWSVHLFTASGLLAGFAALVAVGQHEWRWATIWLLVSQLIDGVDGSLARYFRVREVLPNMEGKNIDFVIDFATYAIIPAYFFYEAAIVPPPYDLLCVGVMLMVAAIYYGKEGMVHEEQFFIGFPVMWNFVVFYQFFILGWSPFWNILLILVLGVFHFIPIKVLYPSRAPNLRALHWIVSLLTIGLVVYITWVYPDTSLWANIAAKVAALYFIGMSIYYSLRY